jgi:hypothetical protein
MTSQINYNNIDGTYPIAGQDNSSQGFRDNFTNTKNNFQVAYNEITDLQNKVILASPLNNGIFNNNMQGNLISNPQVQGMREKTYNIGNVSGSINVDFNIGSYQTMTLTGSTVISSFTNFAQTNGSFARIKIQVTVSNAYHTLTLPATANINLATLAGINPSTRVITFDGPGVYVYEFNTVDGGASFSVIDLSNNRDDIKGGNLTITTNVNGNAATGISMSVTNIGGVAIGNITATNFFGNIVSTGTTDAVFSGTITANTLVSNLGIQGTLTTALQPNITLLGTLSSLAVTGNANIGNLTVSGVSDLCGSTLYGVQYVTIGEGGSQTVYSNVGAVIIEFSSNISSASLTMPTSPSNGQTIKIGFGNNTCSTLSHVASGQTLLSARTAGNAAAGGEWLYLATKNTWYKVG